MIVALALTGCGKEEKNKIEKRVVFEKLDAREDLMWIDNIPVYADSASARFIFYNLGSEKMEYCDYEFYISGFKATDGSEIIHGGVVEMKYNIADTIVHTYYYQNGNIFPQGTYVFRENKTLLIALYSSGIDGYKYKRH